MRNGKHVNQIKRSEWRSAGGNKKLVVDYLDLLERKKNRTTSEMCQALSIERDKLNALTRLVREFLSQYEPPGVVRVKRDKVDPFIYYYSIERTSEAVLRAACTDAVRQRSYVRAQQRKLSMLAGQDLRGKQAVLIRELSEVALIKDAAIVAELERAKNINPRLVEEAKLDASGPTPTDILSKREASSLPIWEVARRIGQARAQQLLESAEGDAA